MMQAYAAVKFADSCLRGLRGDAGVVECAFVPSQVCLSIASSEPALFLLKMLNCGLFSQVTELPFFASRVRLGRNGVEEIYPLGPLNEYERSVKDFFRALLALMNLVINVSCSPLLVFRVSLEKAKKELGGSIDKGVSFVKK